MAAPTPPPRSSQASFSSLTIRRKHEDLTYDEKMLCGDLLNRLALITRVRCGDRDQNRKEFWDKVFVDWDTTKTITLPPAKPPRRRDVHSSIEMGTLTDDCPPPTGAGKKLNNDETPVPPKHRQAGALVRLKVVVTTGPGLEFKWTDAKHRLVPYFLVQVKDGITMLEARRMAVQHYDREEVARVGGFNEKLAIYRAKKLLCLEIYHANYNDATMTPAGRDIWDEDDFKMVKITFASDLLENHNQNEHDLWVMVAASKKRCHDFTKM